LPSTIEQIHQEYQPRGLSVVAVDMKESPQKVARWVKDKNVSFTVVLDRDGAATRAFDITATPAVFLIGRNGRLVGKAAGTKEWSGPRGRALLDALLAR